MSREDSDPQIVNRLNSQPPYFDDQGKPSATPVNPVSTIAPEPVIEAPTEASTEATPKEEVSQKVEVTEDEALDNSKNPERTKAYIDSLKEKIKNQNKDLLGTSYPKEVTTNRVPTPHNYPSLSQDQIDDAFSEIMDENGYVDRSLLNNTLKNLVEENARFKEQNRKLSEENQRTNQRIDNTERKQVMGEINKDIPELDPKNEKFSQALYNYVQKNVVSEWLQEVQSGNVVDPNDMEAQGERVRRIAEKGKLYLREDVLNDVGEIDPQRIAMIKSNQKHIETEDVKRNINATNPTATRQVDFYEQENLVAATRNGKRGALAERLKRSGY